MSYEFSLEKNEELIRERGVSFPNIIEAINNRKILLNIKHPKHELYPNQWMYIIEYKNYTYSVPYVLDGDNCFLKTIFPNRKYMYLLKEGDQDER